MQYLKLFDESYVSSSPRTGIVTQRDLPFLRKQYHTNIEKIEHYYLSRNYAVRNTHILSRIVQLFPMAKQYDEYEYMDLIIQRLEYLAKHFRFTSDMERGEVHRPYFFGNDGEEVIISNFDYFDIKHAKANWRTINCVDVMRHPRNGLKLMMPLGKRDGERGGLGMVNINIPLLALKYREFEKQQYMKSQLGEVSLSKNVFVIKHVLPFMMRDVVDHIFLNRLMDKYYGRESVESPYKHKFPLFIPEKQISRWVDDTLDVIRGKRIDFVNILRNIKLMFHEDASELLVLDQLGYTRQSKWAALVSRIDYMIFLLDLAEENENLDYNRRHLQDWQRLAIRFKNDNFLRDEFSPSVNIDLQSKLARLREL